MKILALEFSSPQRSAAVLQAGAELAQECLSEVIQTGAQSANALGMIADALREARVERDQIQCLAIGLGPGSYNGIRSAIALAQGWQLASGSRQPRLLGVSSAECLVTQAQAEGARGRVAIVMDAQRKEFYLAGYEIDDEGRREMNPLHLATLSEVQAMANSGALIIGPEVSKWFTNGRVLFPRASSLGQLALARNDFVPGEKLEPIYLREPNFVKAPPPRNFP